MWIEKKDEEQEGNQQNTLGDESVGAGAGVTPVTPQGSTTAATGNMSTTNPDPVAPGQKFGTIQDYFKGSRSQGEQLGQQFTSKLDTAKQQSEQQIGEAAEGAKGKVAANTIGFDEGLVGRAVADPTKITGSEDDFGKFMQQWDASYKGPQAFEQTDEYSKAAKAAQDAKSKAEQIGTAGGRQQMLQDEFKVYGAGNKGLDEALIQQSGSFGRVGEQAKELSSLQDYLGAKSQEVGTEAQKAKETTEQTKAKTQEALLGEKGAVRQFKSDIDARTAAERTKAEQSLKELQTAVQGRANLSDQQLAMMGVTRQQYNDLLAKEKTAGYSNLQDYLKIQNPNAQISRETVASKADQERDAALAKLTSGSKLLGQSRDAGKLLDFDKDTALQAYLDKIGADEAEREQARLDREAEQRAEEEARRAEQKAKQEYTENQLLENAIIPGIGLLDPEGKIGENIQEVGRDIGQEVGKGAEKVKEVGKKIDKEVLQPVVQPVKEVVKKVENTVKKIFCFDGETMVDMLDGSKKAIKDIKLGDRVLGGGVVDSIRQSYTSNGTRYSYKGIIVTGFHAVKEKRWLRVKDSVHAHRVDGDGIVYSLVTNLHRIYVNGIQFADEHETDKYESLSLDQSLAELNKVVLVVC